MARDWPADDVAALMTLIDDPRHKVTPDGTYRLSDEQARAILDLRLQRLTALGRDEIKAELDKLAAEIADYLDILRSRARIQAIVKDELAAVKKDFATPRRTVIIDQEGEMEDEDLIQREDMVVTVSHLGYVKRVPLSTYRAQRRGGKGRAGMQTRDEDFVTRLFVANTHTPVLFFSSHGRVYKEKVWRLPQAAPQARGKALINILPLEQGERITTIMPLPEDESTWGELDVMFATTRGTVRRNKLSDFVDVRRSGIIAMKLDEGEAIVDVQICTEKDDVLLTVGGRPVHPLPGAGRARVPGPHLDGRARHRARRGRQGDLALDPAPPRGDRRGARRLSQARERGAARHQWRGRGGGADAEEANRRDRARRAALCRDVGGRAVRADGLGARLSASARRPTSTAPPDAAAKASSRWRSPPRPAASSPRSRSRRADQIMLVTDGGQLIRSPVDGIRIAGRSTQGVIVFDTADDERVVSVERLSEEGEENGGA